MPMGIRGNDAGAMGKVLVVLVDGPSRHKVEQYYADSLWRLTRE